MLDERTIFLGERRRVTLDTWFVNGIDFQLTNATYRFTCADMEVDRGELVCSKINTHWLLQSMIEPKVARPHVLEYTYYVGDERIIRRLKINVKR